LPGAFDNRGGRQDEACAGVADNRLEARLAAAGSRRIGRNRDHAGAQATEKGHHEVEPRREEQEGPLSAGPLGIERGRHGPRAPVQLADAQLCGFVPVAVEEKKGTLVGVLRGASSQEFD
jgi:hypothetical protein